MKPKIRIIVAIIALALGLFFSIARSGISQNIFGSETIGEIVIGSGSPDEIVTPDTHFRVHLPRNGQVTAKIIDSDNRELDVSLTLAQSGQESDIGFDQNLHLKPGKYKLRLKDSSGKTKDKEFWWGVLAANTRQPSYLPGSLVDFEIAVLDETGNMVCDADLTLTLTTPSNKKITLTDKEITVNPGCFIRGITNQPDYSTVYQLDQQTGVYEYQLEAVTKNGKFVTSDKFEVDDPLQFIISRDISTRLYPFDVNVARITLTSVNDFSGRVIESIPAGYEIIDPDTETKTTRDYNQLIWSVNLRAGEPQVLEYQYDAPDTSPDFFRLGKLNILESEISVFTEFRHWQMAVDAEVVIASNLKDATVEYNPSSAVVFTDANTGYIFYLYKLNTGNTWGQPVYRKTTDGGQNWGSPVGIGNSSPNASFANIAVWFDRWTPGDTSGNLIHIAAVEVTADDVWYSYIDTANSDTQRSGGWSGAITNGTLYDPAADGNVSITKNTANDIFVTCSGTFGGATSQKVFRSGDGGDTFADTNLTLTSGLDDGDFNQLLPLIGGDVLYLGQDITANKLISKELDVGTSNWQNEITIQSDFVENGTYDISWSASLNKNTGDVFLVANDKIAQTTGSLRFYQFSGTGRNWTEKQRLVNNSPYLLQGTITIDSATNDIFVAYISGIVNDTTDIYYKKSTNSGDSWSAQSIPLNTLTDDFKYIRSNGWNSDMMYVVWYNDDTEDITGIQVPTTVTRSPVPDSSVIDLALNDVIDEENNSPNSVFISAEVGYAFYVDTGTAIRYSKTTDGGDTWGAPVNIGNTSFTWANVAVWYDRWTPGDDTGTKIHLAAQDDTSGTEDVWYNYIDTGNGDAQITSGWISAINTTGWTVNSYAGPSITKATDGTLFIMGAGTIGGTIKNVVFSSGDTGSSWADTGYNTALAAGDFGQLLPYSAGTSGAIIYLKQDVSANQLYSNVYRGGWEGQVDIDIGTTIVENASYDAQWQASLNRTTGNIYLSTTNYIGNAGNDLLFYKMIVATGVWETRPNIITNSNQVIQGSVALDQNSGDIYVAYIRGTINANTDVYFVQSTDDGYTWSGQTQLNTLTDDIKLVRTNLMSPDRVIALWYNDDLNDMVMNSMGITRLNQSGYKLFENINSIDVGPTLALDNTPVTFVEGVSQFRLRLLINAGIAVEALANKDFKLQYSPRSGTCDTSFVGESYQDVAADTGIIRFFDNTNVDTGTSMSISRDDPRNGGHTLIRQTYLEANNFTNSVDPIYGGKDGLWDFSLSLHGAPADTGYCFRVVRSNDTLLIGGYSYIPEIITPAVVDENPSLPQILRHGTWFKNGIKQPFTF